MGAETDCRGQIVFWAPVPRGGGLGLSAVRVAFLGDRSFAISPEDEDTDPPDPIERRPAREPRPAWIPRRLLRDEGSVHSKV